MRRQYKGNTKPTTLASGIDVSTTTMTLVDATNYPDGVAGPFVMTLDLGLAGEEKVLVTSRSANVLSGLQRGFDGTTAGAHSAGAPAAHTISAVDLDEANAHVNATGDVHPQYVLGTVAAAAIATTNAQIAGLATSIDTVNTNLTNSGLATAAALTTSIATKLPLAGGTLTGPLTAPTLNSSTDATVAGRSLPRGRLPGTQVDTPSGSYGANVLVALNATLVNGRRYAVKGYAQGNNGATANTVAAALQVAGTTVGFPVARNMAASEPFAGSIDYELLATSDGTVQVTLRVDTSAGNIVYTAGSWKLRVEDIGT